MTTIEEYIKYPRELLDRIPYSVRSNLQIDNRGNIVLYLRGIVKFFNDYELHFKEYIITIPNWRKVSYSYHFQDNNGYAIFRYVNAKHHPEIETFSDHKHVKDVVLPSSTQNIGNTFSEVIRYIKTN